jgi:hypothetical protein
MQRQFFDLKPGQTLTIGGSRVTLELKSGQRARLKVESDEPTALVDASAVNRPQPGAAVDAVPALPILSRPRLAMG